MPSRTLITDSKISNQARISPQKIAPADESSFLIAQKDKKYQSKKIHGDGTVDSNGKLTIVQPNVSPIVEESLPNGTVKVGTSSGKNEYVKLGSKAGEIAVRDVNGDLHARSSVHAVMATTATRADTAIKATRATKASIAESADKLAYQDGAYYTNVDNHVYPDQTTTSVNGDETITTSTVPIIIEFVPNTSNYPCSFSHTFGYIPDISVYKNNSGTYELIDAQVTATTSNVTVDVSDPSISTRIVAK